MARSRNTKTTFLPQAARFIAMTLVGILVLALPDQTANAQRKPRVRRTSTIQQTTTPATPTTATPTTATPTTATPTTATPTTATPTTATPTTALFSTTQPVTTQPATTTSAGTHNHTGFGPWPGLVLPSPEVGFATGGIIPETTPIKRTGTGNTGNFRVTCGFSHMNFDDPIVHPNKPGAAHLHTYFGNTGATSASNGPSLLSSGNSTCDGGTLNRSAYWIPTVLNAQGQPVAPNYNMIYYKSGYQGNAPSNIAATLPNGLQLVAGDPKATGSQGEPSYNRQVNWSCSTEGWQGRAAAIPACSEGQEILAEIQFPQCWDGKNLSSPDHVSHMAYGTWGVGCPATHPVALPSISFNIHWKVPAGGTTGWHLSSDASNNGRGYSLHADAILAWDPTTSATWLANCVHQNGDCNVGQLSDTTRLMHAPIKW